MCPPPTMLQQQAMRPPQQQQQQQQSPSLAQPHRSHDDPWALNFICCDAPHAASSSVPPLIPSHHGSHTNQSGAYSHPSSSATSPITGPYPRTHPSTYPSPLGQSSSAANCGPGEGCCTDSACAPGECCSDPSCATDRCTEDHAQQGQQGMAVDGSDELMKWACSKEGCEAIQQYLEYCTQPNCQLPTVPPPNGALAGLPQLSTETAHYHMLNSITGNGGGTADGGGLQAPFQPNPMTHQHRRQSSIFDGGVDPSHFQSRPSSSSSHYPQQTSHQHANAAHFHFGHQHQIPNRNMPHQQMHDHTHHHSHSHPHPHPHQHQHQHPHHHPESSFQQHRHSHSNSISSLPQSSDASPNILPWSSTPTPSSTVHTPAPAMFPTHICHWSNCHLTFSSMPDLLGHVAADHLGAPGFGPSNPLPPQSPAMFLPQGHGHSRQVSLQGHQALQSLSQPQQQQQQQLHFPSPNLNLSTASTPTSSSSLPSLSALTFPTPSSAQAARSQAQAEQDRLLSCLWDDCFPLPTECSADQPDQCPPHTHIPAPADCTVQHPHSHTHTHLNPSGEPFSPQTMLRHVLEEHLGVPSDLVGWDGSNADFALEALAAGLAGQPAIVGKSEALEGMREGGMMVELPPPALSGGATPLVSPTEDRSTSPKTEPLRCHWHACTYLEPFPTPAELMEHLSEVHIGRGKESYACLWGDCAHACVEAEPDSGSGDGGSSGSGEPSGSSGMESGTKVEGRLFRSRQKVLRHLQSHTGYRPFICSICDQAFSEAAPLAAHMRRHNEEKPFVCEVEGCGKRFAISSSLTIHMRTHNGDKPFICPHCQKGFVEASNLTKHIRTHTGERPFACPHPGCGKRFPRPDQLKRHVGIHDRERERAKVEGGKLGVGVGKGRAKGKV